MPDDAKTFSLRYVGIRFRNARLPVDVLSDLPAFRDLIVAFAHDAWRAVHADRQRVPKGFDKSFAFDLVSIDEGSAVPKLEWNRRSVQANLPGFAEEVEDIVEAAYESLVSLIADGEPVALSSEKIRALNRLGAGLRDDERIEFPDKPKPDGNVVYLDAHRRKQLITGARETYQTRFEGVGRLVSNNVDGHIILRTEEHRDIHVPVEPEQIIEEFDGSLEQDVQFELLVELDNQDNFRRVVTVYEIGVVDNQQGADLVHCRARLLEISELREGWHDGDGQRISGAALSAASSFFLQRPRLCGSYKIYPTEEGGVLMEVESGGWDLSIGFEADGTVEMYGVAIDGKAELEPIQFREVGADFISEFDRRIGH